MTSIEQRTEVPGFVEPDYTGVVLDENQVASGKHRKWIGGNWEKMGALQTDFLRDQGLRPEHTFLDVGCGSFRGGRHLIGYLKPRGYYGIDANHSVMQAGYDHELTDELRARLPVTNLRASDRFDVDFGVKFDRGLAQSVFTHVSLNHIRLCMCRVARAMEPGGIFYATFNEQPDSFPIDGVVTTRRPKYGERNVFWYYRSDLEWACQGLPWSMRYIGDWNHPGGQKMVEFTRVADDDGTKRERRRGPRRRATEAGTNRARALRSAVGRARTRRRDR